MMNGMCCDSSTDCGCCRTDPTISKRPMLSRDPASSPSCKEQIKKEILNNEVAMCHWVEKWPASSCCAENYKLVPKDERYGWQEVPR
uniref:Uncharacterized protein n=1 Tax=Globodera pallida TaxID=36090 RepID=A0A183CQ30_GLOPA